MGSFIAKNIPLSQISHEADVILVIFLMSSRLLFLIHACSMYTLSLERQPPTEKR